jgi:hypothetical protein
MAPGEAKTFTCSYDGYASWYGRLVTKAVVDSRGEIAERDEGNNAKEMTIRVRRPPRSS